MLTKKKKIRWEVRTILWPFKRCYLTPLPTTVFAFLFVNWNVSAINAYHAAFLASPPVCSAHFGLKRTRTGSNRNNSPRSHVGFSPSQVSRTRTTAFTAPLQFFERKSCCCSLSKESINNNDDNMIDASAKEYDEKFQKRNNQWVILVDDEEDIRMAVGDFLYNQGFQVTACADGQSLLEVLEAEHDQGQSHLPDAIISDIRMPLSDKNGYELVEVIRAAPKWSGIPIVMLTAKAMTQDRVQGYKVGADAFLPKPFDPNELLSILDNVIARSKRSVASGRAISSGSNDETVASSSPDLLALKQQLDEIKEIMERNAAATVQKTNVVLTESERYMLQMICDGCTYAEIAADCNVTVKAVNRFVQKLYQQTETKTRTELVKWAIQVGYVS